ncbi:MAG: PP2C family protein-serine/threonine phosphatase [Sphingomonadales bacterium]
MNDIVKLAGSLSQGKPLSLLIVDDDELFGEYLTLEMEALGCLVTRVEDGDTALDLLSRQSFDVLITDWQMPRMNGIELVLRARAILPPDDFIHIILMTARGETRTIHEALAAGVDDFIYKPLERIQIELRISSARRTVELQRRLKRRNRHLNDANKRTREAYRRIRDDLEAAGDLQRRLLPPPGASGGLQWAWSYEPALEIGGDTLGLVPLGEGEALVFLADVRGHGVPAALESFHLHHRMQQLSPADPAALSEAVATLNREIEAQDRDSYFTLICGLVSAPRGRAWMIRAGHPSPIRVGSNGSVAPCEVEGGYPVGMFPLADYPVTEVPLAPGDRLIMYSDGVTDCRGIDGQAFGQERLEALLAGAAGGNLEALVARIESGLRPFRGRGGFDDDISLLALECAGGA